MIGRQLCLSKSNNSLPELSNPLLSQIYSSHFDANGQENGEVLECLYQSRKQFSWHLMPFQQQFTSRSDDVLDEVSSDQVPIYQSSRSSFLSSIARCGVKALPLNLPSQLPVICVDDHGACLSFSSAWVDRRDTKKLICSNARHNHRQLIYTFSLSVMSGNSLPSQWTTIAQSGEHSFLIIDARSFW